MFENNENKPRESEVSQYLKNRRKSVAALHRQFEKRDNNMFVCALRCPPWSNNYAFLSCSNRLLLLFHVWLGFEWSLLRGKGRWIRWCCCCCWWWWWWLWRDPFFEALSYKYAKMFFFRSRFFFVEIVFLFGSVFVSVHWIWFSSLAIKTVFYELLTSSTSARRGFSCHLMAYFITI